MDDGFAEEELSRDAFLGGRLQLWQPRRGYRAGIDPVLLAAAVPARAGQSVLDLGCGAGAAALCLAARVPGLRLWGLEVQPAYAALARRNAAANGAQMEVVEGDVAQMPGPLRALSFDHVICNPPYFDRARSSPARDAGRDRALGGPAPLDAWVAAAARRLRPGGQLHVIQRAERLPELLTACTAHVGAAVLRPVQPRAGRDAKLVLVQARKGGRADFRLAAPLVLHAGPRHLRDGEDYAPAIARVLREAAPLAESCATDPSADGEPSAE